MTILDAKSAMPREGGPSFSVRHRLFRALWMIVWTLFGTWTPVPLHSWRRLLLSAFGAKIDKKAKIYPGVKIWYPPNLTMEKRACLARGVNCYCMAPIRLEEHALVSQGAHLCAGTHDIDDPDFQLVAHPITLERNTWVAAEAFVGPGVTIGEGAVLGARAVTFKNLEPHSVYIGNPARFLRKRTTWEQE